MATNLDRLRTVMVSAATKETAYDTAAAVDSRILVNAGVIPNDTVEFQNNQDLIGGSEEASNATVISQSMTMALAQNRVKPHTLAFVAAYALGGATTATPSGGTTARKHTITPAAAVAQNSFTMEAKNKTGVQNKWSGCMIDSFNLSFTRGSNRFCDLTASVLGSGTLAAGTATSAEVSEGGLNAADAALWIDNTTYDGTLSAEDLDLSVNDLTSNPSAVGTDLIGFEWDFSNNIDTDFLYTIGSGDQFGVAERIARSQTVTITRLYQDDAQRTEQLADTDLAVQVKVKNAQIASESLYYGFHIVFPKTRIQAREVADQGGRLVETLNLDVLEDAELGSVVLEVFNTQDITYGG